MSATKLADITLAKKSGTNLTLNTEGTYVSTDVYFTLGVQEAVTAGDSASADVNVSSTSHSANATNISGIIGTKTTTPPTDGCYIRLEASGSGNSKVTTAGWVDTGSLTGASTSATKYFPVTEATGTVSGTNTVTPSASISGSNVTFSGTNNGISVTATGGGTASASASAVGATAGYVGVNSSLGSATINASNQTTSATSYITGITVPKDKGFTVTTTADTALDTSSDLDITNNAYRRVDITNNANGTVLVANNGNVNISSGSTTAGNLTVTAYNASGTSESNKSIVNGGKWVATETSTPGTYYGRVTLPTGTCLPSGNIQLTQATSTDVSAYATATVRSARLTWIGGALSGTATATGTGADLSTTNNSGVYITTACTASRAKVTIRATTSGFVSGDALTTDLYQKDLVSKTYYVNGVTLTAPSSGTRTFSVTVPNGNTTATFVFNVDSSGNVTITES